MIRTVADLLRAVGEKERVRLDEEGIKHGPTIGDMYEGLTREILEKSLPVEGVTVSKGFLLNGKGERSQQQDCIIAIGEGRNIPHTESYEHRFRDAVAVVEVKKTLHAADVADSHDKLRSVMSVFEPPQIRVGIVRDIWRTMIRTEYPARAELEKLPLWQQMVFHIIRVEAASPSRIAFGYHGYKKESSFRKAVVEYLAEHVGELGFGPSSLPSLVVSGDHYIMKTDGIPYAVPCEGREWPLLLSNKGNPVLPMLEQIWTRLSLRFDIPAHLFGHDLLLESGNPLLFTKYVEATDGKKGWQSRYVEMSDERLREEAPHAEWEPVSLDNAEFVVVNALCRQREVRLDESDLVKFLASRGVTPGALASSLREKGLAYEKDGVLRLLTDECAVVIHPEKGYVAGENKDGKMTRWLEKWFEARKAKG